MSIETLSPAKQKLADFVRIPDNTEYHFVVIGNELDAKRFIERMRVELAKARGIKRARGHKLRKFKMLVVESRHVRAENMVYITLRKYVPPENEFTSILANLEI